MLLFFDFIFAPEKRFKLLGERFKAETYIIKKIIIMTLQFKSNIVKHANPKFVFGSEQMQVHKTKRMR